MHIDYWIDIGQDFGSIFWFFGLIVGTKADKEFEGKER